MYSDHGSRFVDGTDQMVESVVAETRVRQPELHVLPVIDTTDDLDPLERIVEVAPKALASLVSRQRLERVGFGVLSELRSLGATFIVADLRLSDLGGLDNLVRNLGEHKADAVTVDSLCEKEALTTIIGALSSLTDVFVMPLMPDVTMEQSVRLHGGRHLGPALAFRTHQALRAGARGLVCWPAQLRSLRSYLSVNSETGCKILLRWGGQVGHDPHPMKTFEQLTAGHDAPPPIEEIMGYDDVIVAMEPESFTGAVFDPHYQSRVSAWRSEVKVDTLDL